MTPQKFHSSNNKDQFCILFRFYFYIFSEKQYWKSEKLCIDKRIKNNDNRNLRENDVQFPELISN